MKFYEEETYLKELIEKDCTNEKIYSCLYELILAFLCKKKCCNCRHDAEEIAHDLAVEMFQNIKSGDRYNKLLGYLNKIYNGKVVDYYLAKKDILDYEITEKEDLNANLLVFNSYECDLNNVINRVYLEDVELIIDEVFEVCKYDKNSKNYNNLKLSLALSILNRSPHYFHLDKFDQAYLDILIREFKILVLKNYRY